MTERLVRFILFVALLVGCGSSKETHVATPHETASPSATPPPETSASTAPTAQTPPTELPSGAVASAWHPLLYRIVIAGAKPSYLFGTIHVPDPRIATFPPMLEKAIADSGEIVNEMPLDNANPMSMMSSVQLPHGQTLKTQLPAALHDRLTKVFASKGLPLSPFESFKVWAVAAQVALLDHLQQMMGAGGGKAIDMNIHDKAKAEGKPTSGLETQAEQLAVFDGLTKSEQARMLEQTLDQRDKDQRDGKDPVGALMTLYVAGDEAPLLAELNAGFDLSRPLDKKLLKRLITDRNKRMTDRIQALFKAHPGKSYFFAVGAAHLLGDDGIIAQLKKKGVPVERVQP